ncbi:MAG: c-type cytochrome [bacterium]|nr:c-type cytochrome [bacterium]
MSRIQRIPKRELIVLLIIGLAGVAAVAAVFVREVTPEWKYYQGEFASIVEENLGSVDPSQVPRGIQQIWVEDLDRVDRCTTCHQGMFWTGLEDVEQPWGTHPRLELFRSHPVEEYGCTVCHGGEGYALSAYEGHGYSRHWEEPLLAQPIASEYDPVNPPPLVETNCNYCHRYERSTPGMDYVNRGKEVVRTKGCKICHVINGSGGRMGPDLTHVGDKHAEEFDFSNLATDQLTVFNWHFKHFKSPITVVPESIMPDLNLQSRDALALSMLVMSWRDNEHLPRKYFPGVELKDEQTAAEMERERRMLEGDGAFFVEHSCFVCHSIEAFEIESPTNKGPDLSWAPDDVRTRFSKTVEEFIFEPTGTMEIILGSQIVLTDEQKWEAVNKISKAYDIVKNREQE